MKLEEVLSLAGHYPARKRVGRGTGSGHGKTSGRGTKGRGARAGTPRRFGYEGGQASVIARLPKRGFSNFDFTTVYQVVNVGALERFDAGSRIDSAALAAVRLISDAKGPLKILGTGELTKKLTVTATAFSETAKAKIAQAGGTAEQLQTVSAKVKAKAKAKTKAKAKPKANSI